MKYMFNKYKIIIAWFILFIILFSALYIYVLYQPQETESWDEVIIYNGENSVYTGYSQSELAEKLAAAAEVTPIISKEKDPHHGTVWYKYHYQNNTSITITIRDNSFWELDEQLIKWRSRRQPTVLILNDSSEAVKIVLNIWERFLNSLNCQLAENDYDLSVIPSTDGLSSDIWGWRIIIRQTCNNNIPLENTGIVTNIGKEYSGISWLNIYEWSKVKIEKPFLVSFENAQDIICNETPVISINRSMLNFTGYRYISENVHYYFNYEVPFDNETDTTAVLFIISSYTIDKNGTVIDEYTYEQWICYDLFVNVENGEFKFEEHCISKRIDNN